MNVNLNPSNRPQQTFRAAVQLNKADIVRGFPLSIALSENTNSVYRIVKDLADDADHVYLVWHNNPAEPLHRRAQTVAWLSDIGVKFKFIADNILDNADLPKLFKF